jgi:hypothetical protein
MLYLHSKLKAVDEQADDEIVHLGGFRETDRLADQAPEPHPQRQVFVLQLLGIVFPHLMPIGLHVSPVRSPAIRVKARNSERHWPGFQLEKRLIFSSPEHVG